ncbi:MAG TPA: protein kinase [Gemmatimonadales bacterium]|nr:protein kinase [Gemmatimonadales bacterium]
MFCSRCGHQVDSSVKYCPNCGLDVTAVTQGGAAGTAAQPAADDSTAVRDALKDEYELEKELGRGGMAIVYKARDKALEREVAIKVLPFSLSFDAEFVERFQREARTSAKLEHPNIIPIYRVGKSGRVIYFVMKFLRGKPLSSVISARGALPVPEIKRLLIEACRALGYAHKHGIVHRDIKPDNIMFDELGQAIVTDFGIAKAQSGARLTGTGMAIGTPHYMSPEQARAQTLDGRSDVYSLGVVGYQCLTGHVPFDGEDSFSIGYKHIMEELPTPPLETAEQRDLFAIIQRMMAKKPDDRFQTAEELVASLEGSGGVAAAMSADVATRPTESLRPLSGVATIASQATTPLPRASGSMPKPPASPAATSAEAARAAKPKPRPPRPAPAKSSRGPLLAVGGLVVVVAALAAYYFLVLHKAPASVASADTNHVAAVAPDSAKAPAARPESTGAAAVTPAPPPAQPAAKEPAPAQPAAQPAQPPAHPATTRPTPRRERPGHKAPPAVASATPARPGAPPDCEAGLVSIQNPNRACWDSKPVAQFTPAVGVPASCTSPSLPLLTLNVHVSRTGDVLQAVPASRPSPCTAFQAQVLAQALDFHFSPARKGGQPVSAWVQVVIRPAHQ